MILKNTWYVACQAEEITDKPLGRKICNESMVFYKNAEGKVSEVQDFCPHRGAPLSLGRVCNGQLVCGYHGLVMGCDGHTISMPGHQVRNFEPVKSFAVIERYGFVWVWPGDQTKVDASKMPVFEWFDNPQWAYGGGLYHIACDYRLMIDNLMDLTHETYVHSTSIGQLEIDETPSRTVTEGDRVTTSRFMEGIKAPPFWQMAMRANDLDDQATVDRWQICKFTPPSHVLIEVGVALAGKGGYNADPKDKAYSVVVDFITPETDTSIHYFWGMVRQFKPEDKALTAMIREGQGKIFGEDLAMLEQQQKNLLANPERKLKVLSIDAGGVMSRRVIDRLLAEEAGSDLKEKVEA
jgi:vanillate O-demethylase monooxygenase subunit